MMAVAPEARMSNGIELVPGCDYSATGLSGTTLCPVRVGQPH